MELLSFVVLFVLIFLLTIYSIRKDNNNLFNPHTVYTANIFVFLFLIPIIQFYGTDFFLDRRGIIFTNSMIALSYLFFSIGFFIKKQKGTILLNRLIKRFNIENVPKVTLNLHILIMATLAILIYIYFAEKSGFALYSWLFDPRTGYLIYRKGLGHLYVISIAIFSLIYLNILFFKVNNSRKKLMLTTTIFILVFYFFGNKSIIIFTILGAIVFYNFFIKKIKLTETIATLIGLFLVFILLFQLYKPKEDERYLSLGEILIYVDNYDNGRMFFADFEETFQYVYGMEYISNLWIYVPRAFYSDKPFSYGFTRYVVEHYHPGAAEFGHTPGFGGPVREYLNFGIVGIVAVGFLKGYLFSLFYNYFLKYRNFIGFVLLCETIGFSIFPIVNITVYKVLWYVLNIALLLFHKQIIIGCAIHRIQKKLY